MHASLRVALTALALGGLACAGNKTDDQVGAARDTTLNQTQSGMTDSSGTSTLGDSVTKTRPDQGQPVTSKGDTINAGLDSAGADSSTTR